MAVYHLFDGGNVYTGGYADCGSATPELPDFVQPDLRADGGYAFRHKLEWGLLMHRLLMKYGKQSADLKVGDKLRIFLNPNHATLTSLFVDFRKPVAGFGFKLVTAEGLDLTADKYTSTYEPDTLRVLTSDKGKGKPEDLGGAVAAYTQYAFLFTNRPHTAKVDAVELEVTSLPAGGLTAKPEMLFVRRFEMDGMQA